MMRSNRGYEEFSENAAEYGTRHFARRFTQSELEAFIETRMATDPVIPKPAPWKQNTAIFMRPFRPMIIMPTT